VPVNCGAIVRTLIESELFGTRKGAFSGATEERTGLVRSADGGTLFLDEIAELPEPSQVALLRVLQERAVMPVGGTRAVPIDLRVVAATHQDLAARVANGQFRADLHARLAGHVTRLPRLRDRVEDIGLLVAELLPRLAGERAGRITFARAAGRALLTYDWPYNVRELEQALNTALAITPDNEIGLAHLPERVRESQSGELPTGSTPPPTAAPAEDEKAQAERGRIIAALEECDGNQTKAARVLGISRATLVVKLAIHRLPRPRKPPPP
jgi:DNA-binding NtrC family response regulator